MSATHPFNKLTIAQRKLLKLLLKKREKALLEGAEHVPGIFTEGRRLNDEGCKALHQHLSEE